MAWRNLANWAWVLPRDRDFCGRVRESRAFERSQPLVPVHRRILPFSADERSLTALAAISLRLESCRDMLNGNEAPDALAKIKEIQG